MKPFSEYSAEELAMERLFIHWVRFPDDPPFKSYWEGWLKKYPEMYETVEEARELVRMSSDWQFKNSLTSEEVHSLWGRIRSSIGQVREMESFRTRLRMLGIRLLYYRWYLVALVALLILVLYGLVA